jgi:CheY-like chemotaxis protein
VVLDYWMADMNGMQVAREIRKLNSKVPIIILSAYGELLDESLGVADLWIRKGEEDPQYLLSCLGDLLKNRPIAPHHV